MSRSTFDAVRLPGTIGLLVAIASSISLLGCNTSGTSISPVAATIQSKILAASKPAEIASLKASYVAEASDQQITVVGRIYAENMSPFDPKESVFTIVELPKPGHLNEDPGECPFCRRDLKMAKMAIVQVVDEKNKPYPQSADKLLGLKKNQDVVVTGKSSQIGDTLIIQTTSIYSLPLAEAEELSKQIHPEQTEAATTPSE
ncbi:MAG: hypothetical protein U0930_08515 [Pirellulales bacterium]